MIAKVNKLFYKIYQRNIRRGLSYSDFISTC